MVVEFGNKKFFVSVLLNCCDRRSTSSAHQRCILIIRTDYIFYNKEVIPIKAQITHNRKSMEGKPIVTCKIF